jgi:hypothetical protein
MSTFYTLDLRMGGGGWRLKVDVIRCMFLPVSKDNNHDI